MDGERHEPITNEADFRAAFGDIFFVCNSSTGEEVELMAGGSTTRVTFANRKRYVKMAVDYRLHEFDLQVAAIRRGIGSVVPMPALRLFTWQELEILVAGRPEIDLDVLKRQTSYSGCVCVWWWRFVLRWVLALGGGRAVVSTTHTRATHGE